MEQAHQLLHKAVLRAHNGQFEDAFQDCEKAEACCVVALRHLEELTP
jgi:hypothetical protein